MKDFEDNFEASPKKMEIDYDGDFEVSPKKMEIDDDGEDDQGLDD